MSTRSYIARTTSQGYEGVYAHWDGYPEHNGRILSDHYTNPRKLSRLLSLGSISVLKEKVGRRHAFQRSYKATSTTFYRRDRGDDHCGPHLFANFQQLAASAELSGVEYIYVYDGHSWSVASRGPQFFGSGDRSDFSGLQPLAKVLATLFPLPHD